MLAFFIRSSALLIISALSTGLDGDVRAVGDGPLGPGGKTPGTIPGLGGCWAGGSGGATGWGGRVGGL